MSDSTSQPQADLAPIIERIQKILARKTEAGASEEEAASAMRIAQAMMAKYNLDMAEIEVADTSQNRTTTVERVKGEVHGRSRFKWQRQLAKYVAEANFCYHLLIKDSRWIDGHKDEDGYWCSGRYASTVRHVFVGRKANVITAQLMYSYLTQAVEDNLPAEDHTKRLSRAANSWKEGCTDRLCERLADKRKDLIDAHDAKVKEAEAAVRAKAAAKYKAAPKQLEGNLEVEVGNAVRNIAEGAYDARDAAGVPEEVERPEASENDTWNPADVTIESEPVSTSMVLASEYDAAEREANIELAHGQEPGTIAKYRAKAAERQAAEAAKEAAAEMNNVEAPIKAETERQRQARMRREREQELKNRRRWAREDAKAEREADRAYARRDHDAYRAGAEAGKKIGIDLQVGSESAKTVERKMLK